MNGDEKRRHVETFRIGDPLANDEQKQRRSDGRYDPRPASGAFVARRLRLRCVRCGDLLGHVDEYEHRLLFHSVRESRWTMRPSGLKCRECYEPLEAFPVDLDEILARVDAARHAVRTINAKIGAMPR